VLVGLKLLKRRYFCVEFLKIRTVQPRLVLGIGRFMEKRVDIVVAQARQAFSLSNPESVAFKLSIPDEVQGRIHLGSDCDSEFSFCCCDVSQLVKAIAATAHCRESSSHSSPLNEEAVSVLDQSCSSDATMGMVDDMAAKAVPSDANKCRLCGCPSFSFQLVRTGGILHPR
jgi:hypothetical protein